MLFYSLFEGIILLSLLSGGLLISRWWQRRPILRQQQALEARRQEITQWIEGQIHANAVKSHDITKALQTSHNAFLLALLDQARADVLLDPAHYHAIFEQYQKTIQITQERPELPADEQTAIAELFSVELENPAVDDLYDDLDEFEELEDIIEKRNKTIDEMIKSRESDDALQKEFKTFGNSYQQLQQHFSSANQQYSHDGRLLSLVEQLTISGRGLQKSIVLLERRNRQMGIYIDDMRMDNEHILEVANRYKIKVQELIIERSALQEKLQETNDALEKRSNLIGAYQKRLSVLKHEYDYLYDTLMKKPALPK